ncbi:MAG: hypothetical protein P4M13_06585 [Alphaproteobacteria bacterium]|nr:hypothetical protein [Alphaproteobacteria bacterium]
MINSKQIARDMTNSFGKPLFSERDIEALPTISELEQALRKCAHEVSLRNKSLAVAMSSLLETSPIATSGSLDSNNTSIAVSSLGKTLQDNTLLIDYCIKNAEALTSPANAEKIYVGMMFVLQVDIKEPGGASDIIKDCFGFSPSMWVSYAPKRTQEYYGPKLQSGQFNPCS